MDHGDAALIEGVRARQALLDASELALLLQARKDRRQGRRVWVLDNEPDQPDWRDPHAEWLHLHPEDDPRMRVRVRLGPLAETQVAMTAVLVERDDRAVSARDLHGLRLRGLLDAVGPALRPLLLDDGAPVRPARPGRKGYPLGYWQGIADDYRLALEQAPREPIKWMRSRYPEADRPADATMRRQVKKVQTMIAKGEL